ncbi:MAG: patatin-like phospholipase family protein, partial [Clostridia bacterium]|nr:patatin-like phospholipase family protein [Clostridia bacterium]
MELKIDPNISYALALEGGGAKGAYQIGVWRALRQAGIRIAAVAGSSVGSLNGAMIAMGNLEKAEELWKNIS